MFPCVSRYLRHKTGPERDRLWKRIEIIASAMPVLRSALELQNRLPAKIKARTEPTNIGTKHANLGSLLNDRWGPREAPSPV